MSFRWFFGLLKMAILLHTEAKVSVFFLLSVYLHSKVYFNEVLYCANKFDDLFLSNYLSDKKVFFWFSNECWMVYLTHRTKSCARSYTQPKRTQLTGDPTRSKNFTTPFFQDITNSFHGPNKMHQQAPTVAGFGPNQQRIHCQQCQKEVMTTTETKTLDNNNTCIGFLLCLFGCIPCAIYMCACADTDEEIVHSCPSCRVQFGSYKA
jgi:hypothetical protein